MSAEKELLDRITLVMIFLGGFARAIVLHLLPNSRLTLSQYYVCAPPPLTLLKARLDLLTQRVQSSRPQPPPHLLQPPPAAAPNDASLGTYAAMQEMLRQQRLAISQAQQRRDDLKREIDRLSRQAETEA